MNPNLSPRELDVLRLVATGHKYFDIAHGIGRSEQAVKNRMTSIYRRLGVSSQAHAIALLDDLRPGWRKRLA